MRPSLLPLIALAATAGISPGQAQWRSNSPKIYPIERTRELVESFAACSAKKNPGLAHQLLVSNDSRDDRYRKLLDPTCLLISAPDERLGGTLKMTSGLFMFALADVLVRRNLREFNPSAIRSAAPLPKREVLLHNREHTQPAQNGVVLVGPSTPRAEQEAIIALVMYGECVVRADPEGAGKLLETRLNSNDELNALKAMMPAYSSCLDQGLQLKQRAQLRGTVAYNYYRLAYAPKLNSNGAVLPRP